MRSWTAPSLPRLPVAGPPVVVHDSSRDARQLTAPGDTARLYVCGITPYDATHLGHAATYVAFDLLNRAWRNAGHGVDYVQNVTDVDDPLLARAAQTGEDWQALAERETELFREDMSALRVIPPDHYLGAVETIPLVIEFIEQLTRAGAVYELDGDRYFSVEADPGFGSVSGWSREQMSATFAERGGDPTRPGKRDPLDCLVWMGERPDEPAWDSPWGRGRPGWHIECTAIAERHLGAAFDVQGGGRDLVFPHHEMCASEGQVARPHVPFAQAYVHAGLVGYEGEKMSKSRGNLVFVSRLRRDGTEPAALRVALMRHHYRGDWEWTAADLEAAEASLRCWREALARPAGMPAEGTVRQVLAALAADLDAPLALAAIDAWAEATLGEGGADPEAPGLIRAVLDAALGVVV